MKKLREGDKSRGICPKCESIQPTTITGDTSGMGEPWRKHLTPSDLEVLRGTELEDRELTVDEQLAAAMRAGKPSITIGRFLYTLG